MITTLAALRVWHQPPVEAIETRKDHFTTGRSIGLGVFRCCDVWVVMLWFYNHGSDDGFLGIRYLKLAVGLFADLGDLLDLWDGICVRSHSYQVRCVDVT